MRRKKVSQLENSRISIDTEIDRAKSNDSNESKKSMSDFFDELQKKLVDEIDDQ